MDATHVTIGVDNGGTWLRLCVMKGQNRVVRHVRKPASSLEKLPSTIKKIASPYQGRIQQLVVGSKGVWAKSRQRTMRRALAGVARRLIVMSDVEATWLTVFGKKHGIVVIAGTGSIAYGQNGQGQKARAGGLGPKKGDEGSGYWLGAEWLRHTKQAKRTALNDVRRVAQLAPSVIAKALNGHALASRIVGEGQRALAQIVDDVRRKLKLPDPFLLHLHGGLFDHDFYRKGFLQEMRHLHRSFRVVRARQEVARVLAVDFKA